MNGCYIRQDNVGERYVIYLVINIVMEKLIELLNEYDSWWDYDDYYWPYQYWQDRDAYKYGKYYLLSRDYWFIKWLVENDKISNDWIKPRTDLVKEIIIVDYKTGDAIWWKNKYTEVEQLIMYLSIQDEPIRFLCEIIK